MSDKSNIVVGSDLVTGGVSLAPLGTKEPKSATEELDKAFGHAGFVSSDGLDREEKVDTDNITAWGGQTVRIVKKSQSVTAGYTFLEYLNVIVQRAIYGDANVTTTEATEEHGNLMEIAGKIDLAPHRVQVIDMVDGDVRGRLVFHDSQITERDKYTAKDTTSINRKVTWTLLPDDKGEYFHEYWDDGKKRIHVEDETQKEAAASDESSQNIESAAEQKSIESSKDSEQQQASAKQAGDTEENA
ncbi:hypothetical protein OZX67_03810 [Bifidobacterium sp. ESL0728]|uniref:phage tail tube protein n=1 Tax=Bifidobacterium sp. ESL0728 TaxID=2983220 RepID=UPI0023F9569D|nr:hypothetical protein [Bifidobacterium sp. ESL0728]WEV59673.1 hypothetical protein OZX67_03810 [Bifidobacterium sp. ESL0728]